MTFIACYCRVSTRHQKNVSQRVEIDKWIRNSGLDQTAVRWFEDNETGTNHSAVSLRTNAESNF